MATIQRPVKEGSVRTYQAKVGLGFVDILASEMDADLDTIYAAWNGGVDSTTLNNLAVTTPKIADGAVTYAKLAPDAQLWSDTGTALTPGTNFTARFLYLPASIVRVGNATAKTRLRDSAGTAQLLANSDGTTTDDATKPQWMLQANATDALTVHRAPAGATSTWASVLNLDATGQLTVPGVQHFFGTAPGGGRLIVGPTIKTHVEGGSTVGALGINHYLGPQDATKASWSINLDLGIDQIQMLHRNANAAAGQTALFAFDNGGNFYITGPNGSKSTGTLWVNSSDPRLKRDVTPYTAGLEAIRALQPIRFKFNGRGGTIDDDYPCWGLDASAVREIMPECVSTRRAKLDPADETETEILTLDASNILWALLNAVKELAARVETLETPA